ncbi:Na+/H+ antiporter NhaC family protein [Pseudalkalibacillus caeni]|uniref:Na+/H+ antiporter NhaC-like C-terminal domain-containing protein n=1 Tax=Exobacillus caeni TaxID=2574798 RepID=A0A5R9F2N0_9BACL|nr:Na+/H+ antiporter NhaC family protein [Pseudalkalibacillus caeni]TLS37857.1 hypothetical protein FCL54_08545 [Pseudalkalibacillus caeni]
MELSLWLAIVPALLTIILSIWTKQIIPSLFIGVLVGSMVEAKSFLEGFPAALDYILKVLADKGNLQVLLFLYLFSGFVNLIKQSGGIKAFIKKADHYINNRKGVLYGIWGLIPLTFIDCGFRVVSAGSIMKPLADKYDVAKERLAFMLNNTASPIVVIIPLGTTFVGYNIGIINQGLQTAGSENKSAYQILLESIPLQFFSIVLILLTFGAIYYDIKKKQFFKENKKDERQKHEMKMGEKKPKLEPRLFNMWVPMVVLILLSFGLLWLFGMREAGDNSDLVSVITAADPTNAMLLALFSTMLITSVLYLVQGYELKGITSDLIAGGNDLMHTLAILVLAWPLSAISRDLGLSELIKQTIGDSMPSLIVPLIIFIVTGAVTYFIGSSWGGWALLMPVAISLSVSTGGNIPLAVAAVLSGGTFGDVTSPVSGMTNMASNISKANHMKYIKYASYYNFTAAILSAVLFLVAGWIMK